MDEFSCSFQKDHALEQKKQSIEFLRWFRFGHRVCAGTRLYSL